MRTFTQIPERTIAALFTGRIPGSPSKSNLYRERKVRHDRRGLWNLSRLSKYHLIPRAAVEINNYMISGATPVTSLNGSLWKGLFTDNNSPSWADVVIGGAIPIEYNTVQLWRQALAQHLNAITPYAMVLNAEGPGGKVFGNNNNATYGIVNGAVDDADFCNNLTTAGKASVQGCCSRKSSAMN